MSDVEKRFERFLSRIRPTQSQTDLAKSELDFLETSLSDYIAEDDAFDFVKALRAGSYAKHSMLRRHATGDFDADLGIYVVAATDGTTPITDLLEYTEKLLRKAYASRTDRRPIFDPTSGSSVKVRFETTPKITLDVAPIVSLEHSTIPNWGLIPRRDGEMRTTSVTEHILFVSERNGQAPKTPFNQVLRLWKWWRDHRFTDASDPDVASFLLELILGKAFDEIHPMLTGEWLADLRRFSVWVVRHGLREPIWFPDPRVPSASTSGAVVVLDPMNRSNNVSHDWSTSDRARFIQAVAEFRDLITEAQLAVEDGDEEEMLRILDELLPEFRNWSQE